MDCQIEAGLRLTAEAAKMMGKLSIRRAGGRLAALASHRLYRPGTDEDVSSAQNIEDIG